MTEVTEHEFSNNPNAMFARVEAGETLDVTRHGMVIARLTPPRRHKSRYDELVADGTINPASGAAGLRASDWDKFTRIKVPDDVDPPQILLDMREDER